MSSVVVTGIGMTTPVGAQAVQTITSIRAGVARMSEVESFEPPVRDPSQHFPELLVAARCAGLEEDLPVIMRLLRMAMPALEWALEDAAGSGHAGLGRTQLMVFGGEAPAMRLGSRVADVFAQRLAGRMMSTRFARVDYRDGGAAAVVAGLATAAEALMSGSCDAVILGAVDSLLASETLTSLGDRFRLKTPENPVGLVPGEAAAFLVLELEAHARPRGATAYARLGGVATSVESKGLHSDEVCTGEGLAACVLDVLSQMEADGISPAATYCNLNGELHAAEEWGYAINRILAAGRELPSTVVHPADCMGDVGAAMGGVLTGLAADSLRCSKRGWAPPLIWSASDEGSRAAAYLAPA